METYPFVILPNSMQWEIFKLVNRCLNFIYLSNVFIALNQKPYQLFLFRPLYL